MSAAVGTTIAQPEARWIGRTIARVEIGAILFIGTVGVLILGLQPVLLGALAEEVKITASQLGLAATAELLTIGIAAGAAGAVFRPAGLRYWGVGTGLALAGLDALVGSQQGVAIIVNRAAAGIAEGIMIWITVGMIARSTTPARWSGVYLALQTFVQLGYSAVLPATVMVHHGAGGGFLVLSATALACCAVSLLIPPRYDELPKSAEDAAGPGAFSPRAIAVLASVFLFMAFIVGLWAYLEPIAAQAHLPARIADNAVSLSLAAQVAGAATATFVAGRVPYFPIFVGCTLVDLVILAIMGTTPGAALFLGAAVVFGFLWLFVLPFQVPLAIEADPTRRAAVLLPGAQLLGSAAGPFLCSFAVTNTDVRGALFVSGALLIAGFAVAAWLHWHKHRHGA